MITAVNHPAASREFVKAFRRYARESAEVALAFSAAVNHAIERARQTPYRFTWAPGTKPGRIRRVQVKRFRYYVVYVVTETELRVIAIAHYKQKPLYWMRRVPH